VGTRKLDIAIGNQPVDLYFSEIFEVTEEQLEGYGAFDISLVVDLPLFVDPFLLFDNPKPDFKALHESIIGYLRYLRDSAAEGMVDDAQLMNLFCFKEVRQNWLGFSQSDNRGRGLGLDFARSLCGSLTALFQDFGSEKITKGSHLEKLCLIKDGVGRDMISDFTTNLIKGFLCNYTQAFAQQNLNPDQVATFAVQKAGFNYDLGVWTTQRYVLPKFGRDYVILTPKEILTKDGIWINKEDFVREYSEIPVSIGDTQLRAQVDAYFRSVLPSNPTQKEAASAVRKTALKFPQLFDYYIRRKEDTGDIAKRQSLEKVAASFGLYVEQFGGLVERLQSETNFYKDPLTSIEAAHEKVAFLKDMIENKGCHRLFYSKGRPIKREEDLQILYRLVWHGTLFDVSREVNDGRGPADFKISKGSKDKTLVEMKLASNKGLRRNLERQAETYQKASDARHAIKVILFFENGEGESVRRTLRELRLDKAKDIVLIDARWDNKPSGSKA
jgi:hypothetical protein